MKFQIYQNSYGLKNAGTTQLPEVRRPDTTEGLTTLTGEGHPAHPLRTPCTPTEDTQTSTLATTGRTPLQRWDSLDCQLLSNFALLKVNVTVVVQVCIPGVYRSHHLHISR